jgi:hypothetical protein
MSTFASRVDRDLTYLTEAPATVGTAFLRLQDGATIYGVRPNKVLSTALPARNGVC